VRLFPRRYSLFLILSSFFKGFIGIHQQSSCFFFLFFFSFFAVS
jgi:hypothetical protein